MAVSSEIERDVFIVDDEPAVLDALATVLALEGYRVRRFSDGASFLSTAKVRTPACILLDVHMPGRSGLDILRELNAQDYPAPILMISGRGDIPMAVEAIRNGASDFIEKPFDMPSIVGAIGRTIEGWEQRRDSQEASLPDFPGIELLTAREREVLTRIAGGASNKEAGRTLGISPRTVEVHRARIMEKLNARNAADLVRIVMCGRPRP